MYNVAERSNAVATLVPFFHLHGNEAVKKKKVLQNKHTWIYII